MGQVLIKTGIILTIFVTLPILALALAVRIYIKHRRLPGKS